MLLGNSITLTPGTITAEVNSNELLVHSMDDDSADDLTSLRMEQKLPGVRGQPMTGMTVFFLLSLACLAAMIGVYLYRVIQGSTVLTALLGLNGISTKAIILLVVIGTVYDRVDMFVDISTGYALLNLVSALAIAKYLEERGSA